MTNQIPFLDFYQKHSIIPVTQELSQAHFSRRYYLYRTLGITAPIGANANASLNILEVGAGTGDNAVITAKIFPSSSYTFIDGNKLSLDTIRSKIETGLLPEACKVIDGDLNKLATDELANSFDLVICEGTVPGQLSPASFASKLFSLAAEDGQIVLTCADAYSALPELLRRLYRPHLIRLDFNTSIETGVKIFSSHLDSLPAMSRSPQDWVADQILNPWAHQDWQFSILDALKIAESKNCDFLGSSPSFLSDWAWYKEITKVNFYWNSLAKKQWKKSRIFSLDKRLSPACGEFSCDTKFSELLKKFVAFTARASTVDEFSYSQLDTQELASYLEDAIDILQGSSLASQVESVIQALVDFNRAWPAIAKGDIEADVGSFRSWWGRGQQYISFQKLPNILSTL